MANCSICLESFVSPVSLPCGHVFCLKCIRRTVESVKSATNHFCPTCRAPYSVLTVDPKFIPPYLRPHILPPIRKVFIDDTSSPSTASGSGSSSSSTPAPLPAPPASASAELGLALAEVNALRQHCATWRKRAESHAMGNGALLGLARAAKDCALRMRAERDAERSQCVLLKRKLAELMPESEFEQCGLSTTPAECKPRVGRAAPRAGLPVFLMQMQSKPVERFYDNPADMTASHFGPPMKRRKANPTREGETAPNAGSVDVLGAAPGPTPKAGPRLGAADPARDSIFGTSRLNPLVPSAQ
ncbi:hypothetical protein C8F04DRAFT_567406 [Mycena alexandri]|uniref:RING-type domain-containing protein n=1 Tax=Mycena alexandri TaxID=1745969 RepID=A0AAD6SV18_9AGAR|nr:hypothetical protein C8F04DRAFT_567406 [Mycena alexandri]